MADIVQRLLDDDAARFGVAMGVIETFADAALKKYAQTDKPEFLAAGVGGYGGVVYIFQRALRKEHLGRVNGFWNAFTTISDVLVGSMMGEKYSEKQLLGFALISCGIFLI